MKPYKNPFMEKRREHLQKAYDILNAAAPIEISKACALVEINMGASKDRAREYVLTHVKLGSFKLENGKIIYIGGEISDVKRTGKGGNRKDDQKLGGNGKVESGKREVRDRAEESARRILGARGS